MFKSHPKVLKAFDLMVVKTESFSGSTVTVEPILENVFTVGSTFDYVWMISKGHLVCRETTSGEIIEFRKGESTLTKPFSKGEWRMFFMEDTESLCISPFLNETKTQIPNKVAPFALLSGQDLEIPKDSRLFLGSGSLQIDDRTLNSPAQLRFSKGNKIVHANEDSFGFFILT